MLGGSQVAGLKKKEIRLNRWMFLDAPIFSVGICTYHTGASPEFLKQCMVFVFVAGDELHLTFGGGTGVGPLTI